MYFPYLRGKREEALAVRQANLFGDLTVPIFEPIRDLSSDREVRFWQRLVQDERYRIAIITNSANGDPPPSFDSAHFTLDNNLPHELVLPALEIRSKTLPEEIRRFGERFRERTCVVIHRNHIYTASFLRKELRRLKDPPVHVLIDHSEAPQEVLRALPARGRVLVQDGFAFTQPNKDYPRQSHFGSPIYTFNELGFDGFGDFTIVGDRFSIGGGAAKCMAFHLTEIASTTVITNHFLSDPPHVKGDLRRQYFSALDKLVEGVSGEPALHTSGVAGFRGSHDDHHFPGHGLPKRWSIIHHLEIMDRELAGTAFDIFV